MNLLQRIEHLFQREEAKVLAELHAKVESLEARVAALEPKTVETPTPALVVEQPTLSTKPAAEPTAEKPA